MVGELTHIRGDGSAHMVDVTGKQPTVRSASAVAEVRCAESTLDVLRQGEVPKGDVMAVARIAGIQGAKRASELIPLAHVIGVHGCEVDLELLGNGIRVQSTVRTADRTGVEMEALTAVTVAALTLVDMLKSIDRTLVIREAKIVAKSGGRSGDWVRPHED
ncbi:molybdenum cofactor biosynthesis protein C [Propionibacterium sp. oral taxon 192 str. F0372]|mgnify:FL=1|uniref:cyclic pyranopterin monophosphate synthase MoaC n=1 Tax=Propionibacterium sp. oral taxon 192 TaxID=671222 RepID=UPI0003537255|nr:cyclic pyranopterin monophosphate synthase MoaC [Propionibacterium sp. oral taxon 192]EPH02971.1 molybdenum cofactor biosynthesis protein C [Propionibacterium sp. oral taxon 192 str. F0372]